MELGHIAADGLPQPVCFNRSVSVGDNVSQVYYLAPRDVLVFALEIL
jgi:hypothetical protein